MPKKQKGESTRSPHPEAKALLERWDGGDTISTVEMGGLGPGYEQAIQLLAVEIVRDNITAAVPKEAPTDWGETTLRRLEEAEKNGRAKHMGFSGAQFGGARNLAYAWLTRGTTAVQQEVPIGRRIIASKAWPHLNGGKDDLPRT